MIGWHARPPQVEARDQNPFLAKPCIERHQIAEASNEQEGADHQHQRQCNLRDDQRAPQAKSFTAVCRSTASGLHRQTRGQTGCTHGRHKTEQQDRDHGKTGCKRKDPPIERQHDKNPVRVGRQKADQERAEPPGKQRAAAGADHRDEHALGEQLADNAAARRTNGQANG